MLTVSIMHLWLEKEAKLKSPRQMQEKLSASYKANSESSESLRSKFENLKKTCSV